VETGTEQADSEVSGGGAMNGLHKNRGAGAERSGGGKRWRAREAKITEALTAWDFLQIKFQL